MISVLTEKRRFNGTLEDLAAVRKAVQVPVLRKDFVVSSYQLWEARAHGADLVLLIVAALEQSALVSLVERASSIGLVPLVEIHAEEELERAVDAGARVIGVNQRDLHTFEVDTSRALRVGKAIPEGVLRVAESGIRNADELRQLADGGFDAVLVGEALVTSGDATRALLELRDVDGATGGAS